ncbi:outer membrane homotrimeric porin [Desulfomicrobium orale]|uniref:Porin domain-containing protein n=1 Tax=Desulfomicrobium orale DSM 12838 TaxID=888061 RepID=A0A109W5U4_9BACT|nr:outer membrane homotrimeric porin [Desulfomicrobium orale]AMD92616.1 hypothetical protein AXF15_05470 [Desulfomicrobium orale DSM 12838]
MKRFAFVALLAALCFGVASSASATELKVKGNLDVYGIWSANLNDFNSDVPDADNYATTQRMRTYFTFLAHENLKAVLGLEMDHVWGQGGADWGTDGKGEIEIKHAYLDFNFPDTQVNVKAGLQEVALPSVFGNPIFDDDAAALMVSAPINDMVGVTVAYTRGVDGSDNFDASGKDKDDLDMAFLAVPVTTDALDITPYFAYAWAGKNTAAPAGSGGVGSNFAINDDATAWWLGLNAEIKVLDPLTFAADVIYGQGRTDDKDMKTKGWYAALAASYKFDMLTATLFSTYGTGVDDAKADKQTFLPTLAEGWGVTPYIGGVRAFNTGYDSFFSDAYGPVSDGTGLWTVGLDLNDITFVENLSHRLMVVYAQGTSDKNAGVSFDTKDSAWEVYLVNKYMIYENLAAINELGFLAPHLKDVKGEDPSYFGTIGFQYKF